MPDQELCKYTVTGCDRPATKVVVAACVHEHFAGANFCDEHAETSKQMLQNGKYACLPCITGYPDQHWCDKTYVYTEDIKEEAIS